MKPAVFSTVFILYASICPGSPFTSISAQDTTVPVDIDPSTLPLKQAYATRIEAPPIIDGDLSDPAWQEAVPITDLLQVDPNNLYPPTEATEVRLLYDNEYLYVAFRNYDSEPDKIMARLTRRDSWTEAGADNADWVGISLDSRNDNRTGYAFIVNAAGVEVDMYIYDDRDYDLSWNGVWNVEVKVDSLGWTAEYIIPFFLFWFSSEPEQTWGLELNRGIYRKQERHEWPAKKRGVQGIVSRFGILKGIRDVPAPRQLEVLPYTLGGYRTGDVKELTKNIGLDVEYGVGSNTTLNLTFNPDFGQVEANPSVLNLTAFETFYEEKRLFFVEGGSFFRNRIQMFYSRRIGKRPGFFSPNTGTIVSQPEVTTILAASKLTGRMPSRLEFGIIESVTAEEYGVWEYPSDEIASIDSLIDENGLTLDTSYVPVREKFLLEPYTNYFVGRVKYPVFNDISTIGFMVTDIRRRNAASTSSGVFDWRLNFLDNRLNSSGQAAFSQTENGRDGAGRFSLGYEDQDWWDLRVVGSWYGNNFEINDIGFLSRNGTWSLGSFGGIRLQDPWGPFLRNELEYRFFYKSRNDGLALSKSLNIEQTNTTMSYWSFGFGTEQNFASFDDGDTFKDSLAWEIGSPRRWAAWAFLQSDIRKRVIVNPVFAYGEDDLGGSGYMARLGVTVKPTDYLTFSVDATRSYLDNRVEWVGIDSDSSADHIIYSSSKQRIDDIQIRLNWTFSPDLSFQMWVQPFSVDVDYYRFKSLQTRNSLEFAPYAYGGDDPDFKIDNAVGTFVLRWEYLSGSTLFIVYSLNDSNYFSSSENSWTPSRSNTLFIKLNYWFRV